MADLGKPHLSSETVAKVEITVTDGNYYLNCSLRVAKYFFLPQTNCLISGKLIWLLCTVYTNTQVFLFLISLHGRLTPLLSFIHLVNDCAPMFTQKEYNVTLLLPTYENVAVIQVNATDQDSSENSTLRYDIIEGNKDGVFAIDPETGVITTR